MMRRDVDRRRRSPDAFLAQPVPRWLRRVVGGVALAVGCGLSVIAVVGTGRALWVGRGLPERLRLAMLVLFVIAVFLLLVGWRLVRARPPRHGSTLSRPGWIVLGLVFTTLTLWMAIIVGTREPIGMLCGAIFAVCCFGVAFRPR